MLQKNIKYIVGAGVVALGISWKLLASGSYDQDYEDTIQLAIQQLQSKDIIIKIPPGLTNNGNTCYINSVLQCLASSTHIKDFICKVGGIALKNNYTNSEHQLSQSIVLNLLKVVSDLTCSTNDFFNPADFIRSLEQESEWFIYKQQQVLHHELLNIVFKHLDQLVDCELEYSLKSFLSEPQIYQNPLKGKILTYLYCQSCSHKYMMKVESSFGLSLDIRSHSISTMESALDGFFAREIIEGYTCTKCSLKKLQSNLKDDSEQQQVVDSLLKQSTLDFQEVEQQVKQCNLELQQVKSKVVKITELQSLPAVQVIHFKRLTVNMYGDVIKLQKHISFQNQVVLQSNTKKISYILTGVIAHFGQENFGHYITFRKLKLAEDTYEWFFISDAEVRRIDESKVFQCQPYLLFYDEVL